MSNPLSEKARSGWARSDAGLFPLTLVLVFDFAPDIIIPPPIAGFREPDASQDCHENQGHDTALDSLLASGLGLLNSHKLGTVEPFTHRWHFFLLSVIDSMCAASAAAIAARSASLSSYSVPCNYPRNDLYGFHRCNFKHLDRPWPNYSNFFVT